MSCPSWEVLEKWASGLLVHEQERESVSIHLARCNVCRDRGELIRGNLAFVNRMRREADHTRDAPPPQRDDDHLDVHSCRFEGYENVREISRGGQGVVYKAVQRATKQRVAIKVLLQGSLATATHRKRFEREIELAAQLRHPHIVSVLHSGSLSDGRSFLVMDYVRRLALDTYVHERKLSLRKLLELFAQICDAVQYAHQRGIIHRDLKPSNILVDSDGSPRVVDFGLAKRLNAPSESIETMTMQLLGTIAYMSPEQTRGNPGEVDTRSDVYSLGVILFQLLTGQFPYPVTGTMHEVMRHILESAPSSAITAWSSNTGVQSRDNARTDKGSCPIDDEVETIVIKALAKERERRYQSAGELARDISRYLAGDAIEAKRDSGMYVLRKALKRHRVLVLATMIATVALAIGGMSALWQWRVANSNLRRASDVVAFLKRVLTVQSGDQVRRADMPLHEVLTSAARSLDQDQFRKWPEIECDLRLTLGDGYQTLGMYRRAHDQTLACIALASTLPQQPNAWLAEATHKRGTILWSLGNMQECATQLEEALDIRQRLYGKSSAEVAQTLTALGLVAWNTCQSERAESLHSQASRILRQVGDEHALSQSLQNWGLVLERSGRWKEAEAMFQEAIDLAVRSPDFTALSITSVRCDMARLLRLQGRVSQARKMLEELINGIEEIGALHHPSLAESKHALAYVLWSSGDIDGAVLEFRTAQALAVESLGHEHADTGVYLRGLGAALLEQGQFKEGEELLRVSVDIASHVWVARPEIVAVSKSALGEALARQGRFDEAEPLLLDSYQAILDGKRCMGITRLPQAARRLAELYELRQSKSPNEADVERARTWRAKVLEHLAEHPNIPEAIAADAAG